MCKGLDANFIDFAFTFVSIVMSLSVADSNPLARDGIQVLLKSCNETGVSNIIS